MDKQQGTIFYSWQSDLPNATNRSFIEKAIENAIKELKKDDTLKIDPVFDRDTLGISGSPEITKSILEKIEKALIFVCDVSIINKNVIDRHKEDDDYIYVRPTCNPNVLTELGYALGKLGSLRVIMVANIAYGELGQLPFDLHIRRVIDYKAEKGEEDRSEQRKKLEKELVLAIRSILKDMEPPITKPLSKFKQAISAIENNQANQTALVQQYMNEVVTRINQENPQYDQENRKIWDTQFIEALSDLNDTIIEFSQLADLIAQINDRDVAMALYAGFGGILDLYTLEPPVRNSYSPRPEHELPKFLGHQLFVIFFAFLIKEKRWELIGELLNEDLYARKEDFGKKTSVPFYYLCSPTFIVSHIHLRVLGGIEHPSAHASTLEDQHKNTIIGMYVTIDQIVEADFFLYLRAQIHDDEEPRQTLWMPQSWTNMYQPPSYIEKAQRIKHANYLAVAIGVKDIPTLRDRLQKRTLPLTQNLSKWGWHYVMGDFDYSTIGTR